MYISLLAHKYARDELSYRSFHKFSNIRAIHIDYSVYVLLSILPIAGILLRAFLGCNGAQLHMHCMYMYRYMYMYIVHCIHFKQSLW